MLAALAVLVEKFPPQQPPRIVGDALQPLLQLALLGRWRQLLLQCGAGRLLLGRLIGFAGSRFGLGAGVLAGRLLCLVREFLRLLLGALLPGWRCLRLGLPRRRRRLLTRLGRVRAGRRIFLSEACPGFAGPVVSSPDLFAVGFRVGRRLLIALAFPLLVALLLLLFLLLLLLLLQGLFDQPPVGLGVVIPGALLRAWS